MYAICYTYKKNSSPGLLPVTGQPVPKNKSNLNWQTKIFISSLFSQLLNKNFYKSFVALIFAQKA